MSNIKVTTGTVAIEAKFTTFSDGSETVQLVIPKGVHVQSTRACVSVSIEDCNRDLIRIGLVKDALDRSNFDFYRTSLLMPYVPQARADRVFGHLMPLPIKLFTSIINSYGFSDIFIYDPHSDVTSALLNNVHITPQEELVRQTVPHIEHFMGKDFTICAPDVGASKKVDAVARTLEHTDYIQGLKIRNVMTGDIVKCDLDREKVSGNILIVDDISDGGASFKFLAKKLKERGAGRVGLFVSHGIFAKGLSPIREDIDFVFIHNIVGNYITRSDIDMFNTSNN